MPKPVASREFVREFKKAGWKPVRQKGSHVMFQCACEKHQFVVPAGHKQISGGVAHAGRKMLKECGQ